MELSDDGNKDLTRRGALAVPRCLNFLGSMRRVNLPRIGIDFCRVWLASHSKTSRKLDLHSWTTEQQGPEDFRIRRRQKWHLNPQD